MRQGEAIIIEFCFITLKTPQMRLQKSNGFVFYFVVVVFCFVLSCFGLFVNLFLFFFNICQYSKLIILFYRT